jgi:NAD(P)-dependent dehydrogenase (short-subunit alcohol dehydrogenase family)
VNHKALAEPVRTVVITGGAGHLGRSVARWWAKPEVQVVLIDRDADKLKQCRIDVERLGASAIAIEADITESGAVQQAITSLPASAWRAPPSLVLTHGIAGKSPGRPGVGLATLDDALWRTVLDTNLTSIVFTVQCFLPIMKRAGGGRVVLVSSAAGLAASPTAALPYSVSKAAVAALPRILAPELAALGVLINAVAPGKFVNPDWPEDPDKLSHYQAAVPIGRLASADEVAELIGFLGSAANTYLTGQTVLLDGGRLVTTATP